jgi:hypothetical protein
MALQRIPQYPYPKVLHGRDTEKGTPENSILKPVFSVN